MDILHICGNKANQETKTCGLTRIYWEYTLYEFIQDNSNTYSNHYEPKC